MDDENVHPVRTSGLRPPTKIGIPSYQRDRSLYEMTDSDANARDTTLAPQGNALKHKPFGLPEPAPKRKTLAERAGEPSRNDPAAPSSGLPISAAVKATTLAGSRYASNSSTNSSAYVSSSYSSRQTSNTSITGRPPSSGGRSQSAFGHSKNKFSSSAGRPATAFESTVDPERSSVARGKRQGMLLPQSFPQDDSPLVTRRMRRRNNMTDNIYSPYIMTSSSSSDATSSISQHKFKNPFRDVSISACMQNLSLGKPVALKTTTQSPRADAIGEGDVPSTPSCIPKLVHPSPIILHSSPSPFKKSHFKSPHRHEALPFLNKDSNTRVAWDTKGRLEDVEALYTKLCSQMESTTKESSNLQEHVQLYKTRSTLADSFQTIPESLDAKKTPITSQVNQKLTKGLAHTVTELESIRSQLTTKNQQQQSVLEELKAKLTTMTVDMETARRTHSLDLDELKRQHRNEMEDARDVQRRDADRIRRDAQDDADRMMKNHKEELAEVERRLKGSLEEEREKRAREVQDISAQLATQRQNAELENSGKDRETEALKMQLNQANGNTEEERAVNNGLRKKLGEAVTNATELEATIQTLKAKASFLESDSQAQSQAFADLRQQAQDAIDSAEEAHAKLRAEETLRRKLHNQVQELKGNIRVFCRVRPKLESDVEEPAKLDFPDTGEDSKELVVLGPDQKSALGKVSQSKNNFSFDRVFAPSSRNSEIFEEISQLIQSALDGYNVCIFCYGQTGSGKTYTMSSEDGMIPLAVHQIYNTAAGLQDKGWKYTMEGSFVEVYNENLNDLLGKPEDIDKQKLQIIHEGTRTAITDVTSVVLESPDTVNTLLKRAGSNRSVAATKANSRSSRSHSVFILKLIGQNSITGERSEGTLNLVDLAGSERLAHSQAEGDRLKETQSINKSLSCLGDVISALGQGKEGAHIPYRNSKLTYLLQNSLGGNSKTLMFVMISPLKEHLSETLTSLKFATKVHNTHIGTAKKQTRVKD